MWYNKYIVHKFLIQWKFKAGPQLGGRGVRPPLPYFENKKKVTWDCKECSACIHLWVKFSIQNGNRSCKIVLLPLIFAKGFKEIPFLESIISLGSQIQSPANIYLLKVNNKSTRKRSEICSKLTLKTPEGSHWRRSGVFINFNHISFLFLVLLLLTLNK